MMEACPYPDVNIRDKKITPVGANNLNLPRILKTKAAFRETTGTQHRRGDILA
jgi:hypothetical protein